MKEAFVAVQVDRDVLQQLEAAFKRVGAYAFPPILWEEDARREVLAACSGNSMVFRAAFSRILATMDQIMAETHREAMELGGGQSAVVQGRARSRETSSNALSALQVNSRVFEAMFLELKLGILLQ
jgi:hypothetical protein